MRTLAKLIPIALGTATLFACSAPHYQVEKRLGTYAIDLSGPVELALRMDVKVDDPGSMSCADLWPFFELRWLGDEGDVDLQVWAGDDRWEEATLAEDGMQLTTVSGELKRCRFDATVLLDAAEPLQGAITVTAFAGHDGFSDTRGSVKGSVEVVAADEEGDLTED